MITIDKDIVLIGLQADTKEAAIAEVVKKMAEHGYVEHEYYVAVIEREKDYPTGLPSEGVRTAVPHAFSDTVKKTGVGIARLVSPVIFHNMADKQEELPVELIFVMANAGGEDAHINDLQELMSVFSKKRLLLDLMNAETTQEFADIFADCDSYTEEE